MSEKYDDDPTTDLGTKDLNSVSNPTLSREASGYTTSDSRSSSYIEDPTASTTTAPVTAAPVTAQGLTEDVQTTKSTEL